MATAEQFRHAAEQVLHGAEQIGRVAQIVRSERDEIAIDGGLLAEAVDTALTEIGVEIGSLSDVVAEIAEQMLLRALMCDAFTQEILNWLDEIASIKKGRWPPKPQPTASWMESSV